MRILYSVTFAYCALVCCCQAQRNLSLTNAVIINESGTRQILFSVKTLEASSNNFKGDKTLLADQPNYWVLYNTNVSSGIQGAFLPLYHFLAFNLMATNGIPIPKTDMGKTLSEPPKSLTDDKTGKFRSVSPYGYHGYPFPALTNLFNFPSNGVYIFELRCWAWQTSKKRFVLSAPIRVKVIKESTNSPP